MGNLERLLTFAVLSRIVFAITAGAEATFSEVEPCDDFVDVLTGCGDTVTSVMTSLVLGTIPGPDWPWLAMTNAALVIYITGRTIFAVLKLARGVPDQ